MSTKPGIVRQLLAIGFIGLLLMVGCSGGGGGGSTGTGLDPIEVEVGTELDAVLAGMNARNLDQAMAGIDSNLQYFRSGSTTPLSYSVFRDKLSAFLTGAASITVSVVSRSVVPAGESAATVRGTLVYTYRDSTGLAKSGQEECEMSWERVSRWGVKRLSGFNLAGLAFPPAP